MLILIFGILVLVYCSKYKKHPQKNTRKTLKVLFILHCVFFGLGAASLFGTLLAFVAGSLIDISGEFVAAILQSLAIPMTTVSALIEEITTIVSKLILIGAIMDIIFVIFGLIALIKGASTLCNDQLTAVANSAQAVQMPQYTWGNNPDYYQQNYDYNCQNSNTVQSADTAHSSEAWVCGSCGRNCVAEANFCSHCGTNR